MATVPPSLLDPDKFGLLMQCRQKMDRLSSPQLHSYAQSVHSILSTVQFKNLLFVGLNSIRNDIEYHQFYQMKQSINKLIEQIDKEKKSKRKQKPNDTNEPPMSVIPKNASLTKWIPFDIISNHICTFLKMSSITHLAQCDRQLAIICHTPTSIGNLMHRYDVYRYIPYRYGENGGLIDGHYHNMDNWSFSAMHRFKNVERLSISLEYFDGHSTMFNTTFRKVKHLSFYDHGIWENEMGYPYNEMHGLPLLESISFINFEDIPPMLHFMKQYACKTRICLLKSVSFVDCHFDSLTEWPDPPFSEYKYLLNFILPPQPNTLEVLKFENSWLIKPIHADCSNTNGQFENIDTIRSSLTNLKGIVYGEPNDDEDDLFLPLCRIILGHLSSFKSLESIHTHCLRETQLLSSYLNTNNTDALHQITELCISVPFKQNNASPLDCLAGTMSLPKLEKLCLVIPISENDEEHVSTFEKIVALILRSQIKLRVFQIVALIIDNAEEEEQPDFCSKRLVSLTVFLKQLTHSLCHTRILPKYPKVHSKQSLTFRIHIKTCHNKPDTTCRFAGVDGGSAFADTLQHLLLNYLITYPFGKIQVKMSWNAKYSHSMGYKMKPYVKGLNGFNLRIKTRQGGNSSKPDREHLHYDMDFKRYAISADKKRSKRLFDNETKWKVDCRFCCNTPWI
eukprot:202704_1